MKITSSVKFNMNKAFEMHEQTVEFCDTDLPEEVKKLSQSKKMIIMTLYNKIGLTFFQKSEGYLAAEKANKRIQGYLDAIERIKE